MNQGELHQNPLVHSYIVIGLIWTINCLSHVHSFRLLFHLCMYILALLLGWFDQSIIINISIHFGNSFSKFGLTWLTMQHSSHFTWAWKRMSYLCCKLNVLSHMVNSKYLIHSLKFKIETKCGFIAFVTHSLPLMLHSI